MDTEFCPSLRYTGRHLGTATLIRRDLLQLLHHLLYGLREPAARLRL